MKDQPFVSEDSIVRKIWGKSDVILFIFAGAAAEFALNKAVDWLYFTGRLPADPLGRLFSTVRYARSIVFSPESEANLAIDNIQAIHKGVEDRRGFKIPDWAYRDVLYMLIYYSISAYELLERKLSIEEKSEVFHVFHKVGTRMEINELPDDFFQWVEDRDRHMINDLVNSDLTADLFKQYQKHLGIPRYKLLIESQKLVVPLYVRNLLEFNSRSWLSPSVPLYKFSKSVKLDSLVKNVLLPTEYKSQIRALDIS